MYKYSITLKEWSNLIFVMIAAEASKAQQKMMAIIKTQQHQAVELACNKRM